MQSFLVSFAYSTCTFSGQHNSRGHQGKAHPLFAARIAAVQPEISSLENPILMGDYGDAGVFRPGFGGDSMWSAVTYSWDAHASTTGSSNALPVTNTAPSWGSTAPSLTLDRGDTLTTAESSATDDVIFDDFLDFSNCQDSPKSGTPVVLDESSHNPDDFTPDATSQFNGWHATPFDPSHFDDTGVAVPANTPGSKRTDSADTVGSGKVRGRKISDYIATIDKMLVRNDAEHNTEAGTVTEPRGYRSIRFDEPYRSQKVPGEEFVMLLKNANMDVVRSSSDI